MGWEKAGEGSYTIYRWKSNAKKALFALIALAVLYNLATSESKSTNHATPASYEAR